MSDSGNPGGGGIGLLSGVFLVFLFCKLTGAIAWSWWWVTAPLWGPFALLVFLLVAGLIFQLIAEALD